MTTAKGGVKRSTEQLAVYLPRESGANKSVRRLALRLHYPSAAELMRAAITKFLLDHKDELAALPDDLANALEGLRLREDIRNGIAPSTPTEAA
jgi:Arc/MetJ-type ribon-helix-helix transcriptional regulator